MQLSLLQIPSIFYVFYCCTFELEVLNTYKFYSIQIFFLDFYFTNVQEAETLNKLSSIILQGKKTPKQLNHSNVFWTQFTLIKGTKWALWI